MCHSLVRKLYITVCNSTTIPGRKVRSGQVRIFGHGKLACNFRFARYVEKTWATLHRTVHFQKYPDTFPEIPRHIQEYFFLKLITCGRQYLSIPLIKDWSNHHVLFHWSQSFILRPTTDYRRLTGFSLWLKPQAKDTPSHAFTQNGHRID